MTRTNLIPGEALIYERVDGVVYARYRDPPHNQIDRWAIGGDAGALNQGDLLSYRDWQDLLILAEKSHTLKLQLDKLLNIYYIIKDEENNGTI